MGKKLLSIIVTVYNNEKYIKKCLESIGDFDKEKVEVIIINDGSEDNSEIIIEELNKENKYHYIKQKNSGVSSARNRGIKEAKGDYIWFIDGDDFLERNSLDRIVKELELNVQIELLYFGINHLDKKYNLVKQYFPNERDYFSEENIFNSPCNKIYNNKFLKKNNLFFNEECCMGEDMSFNFKVFSYIKRIKLLEVGLYNYYHSGEGVTNNLIKRKEIFNTFDELIKYLIEKNKFEVKKEIIEKFYLRSCVSNIYRLIILSDLNFSIKIKMIKEIDKKIDDRKWYFNKKYSYIRIKLKLKFYRRFLKKLLKD